MGIFRRNSATTDSGLAVPSHAVEVVDRSPAGRLFRAPSVSTLTTKSTAGGMAMARGDFDPAKAIREHYLCNTYLYAAIQALGEDLASLTLRCGPDPDKPQDFDPNHPLIRRLGPAGTPNPQTTARQLWQWTVAQFTVTGKFAWEVDPSDLSFWPLISARLNPVATTGGTSYFSSFDYEVGQGKKKNLPKDRVVYHWRPSAMDWRQPESVLQSARLDLSVAVMQDLYDYAFLQNDARPAAVVVHEAFEEDDQRDAWRRQFLDTHRGASNAGKVAFAQTDPEGAKPSEALFIQTLGLSQKDAEFIKRYESKIRSILIAIGVPLTRLGDASARTFANADEEMKAYWKNKVRQLAINFADAVNQYVAPLYGTDKVWWDFSDNEYLRPAPSLGIYESIAAYGAGLMTREEVRIEALGLSEKPSVGVYPVLPAGDVHDPTDAVDAPDAEPAPAPAVEPAAEDAQFALAASAVPALVRAAVEEALAARLPSEAVSAALRELEHTTEAEETAEQARERRARQWRSFDSTVGPLERKWAKRWQKFFDRQAKATLARLEGKRGRQMLARGADDGVDPAEIFDTEYWLAETDDFAQAMYEDTLAASFQAFNAQIGISFDLDAPFARSFIERRANQLAGKVTQTTYDGIKKVLADEALAGKSIPDIAAAIQGLFAQTYNGRATTVARTEVISGYNGGTVEAAQQTDGVVEEMEWISTIDDRTRGNDDRDEYDHLSMDGERVPLGDPFDVQGDEVEYPGDPSGDAGNVINCRCTCAPVVAADRGAKVVSIDHARAARLMVAVAQGRLRVTDPHKALTAR